MAPSNTPSPLTTYPFISQIMTTRWYVSEIDKIPNMYKNNMQPSCLFLLEFYRRENIDANNIKTVSTPVERIRYK